MRRGGGGSNSSNSSNSGNSGNSGRRGGSPRTQNFESNGPDIRVRGNAQQIVDKYKTLAREAATAGNPVMAENYYQHAEHYHRVLTAAGGGENRQNQRQVDGDDNQSNLGAQNSQQQSNGQFTEGEETTGFVRSPDVVRSPEVAASPEGAGSPQVVSAPEVARAPDVMAGPFAPEVAAVPEIASSPSDAASPDVEASAEKPDFNSGAENVQKPERKRVRRTAKPLAATDESVAAIPAADAAPAPTVSQPEAESVTEKVIKAVS